MVEPYKPIYTVKEAGKVLQVNANTVYGFVRSGQLRALKLGAVKIRGKDLEEFINNFPEIAPESKAKVSGRLSDV